MMVAETVTTRWSLRAEAIRKPVRANPDIVGIKSISLGSGLVGSVLVMKASTT